MLTGKLFNLLGASYKVSCCKYSSRHLLFRLPASHLLAHKGQNTQRLCSRRRFRVKLNFLIDFFFPLPVFLVLPELETSRANV